MALLLSFATIYTYGAGDVLETPMIPIITTATKVRFSSTNAGSTVIAGSSVNFKTEFSGLPQGGLSSIEVSYSFSDSFIFNDDITLLGAPGWEVSDLSYDNGSLSFTASGRSPLKSAFAANFSFAVSKNPTSSLEVTLDSVKLFDGEGDEVKRFDKYSNNNHFSAKSAVPLFENLGAALRINNTPALRFGMRVEKDDVYKEAFGSGDYKYSSNDKIKFGIVYIYEDALTGELLVDNTKAHVVDMRTPVSENSNEIVFAVTIENFPTNKTNYVIRPFASFENDEGEVTYFYGDEKVRSAEYVAEIELVNTTDETKKALLEKFIDKE